MKISIVIPTYNEAENLPGLLTALFALPLDISVLVVDDNSPDGTGHLADDLAQSNPKLTVLHRSQKLGLASAYAQGFHYFIEKKADVIGQMDADWSHDPATLLTMVRCLENCDVVFGSRYTKNGSVDRQWPFWRKGLSTWGNLYARAILRVPVRDITTGFRLWRSETLRSMPLKNIISKGYIFQVEMAYLAHCLEFRIVEMPIYFADRCHGKSKMSLQTQIEAALRTWQIWLTHRHLCHIGRAARIQREFKNSVFNDG
ncbi:MAG TPA: polyprenol monophosphomannose synthase [Anaerolineales bacterium]|nr:polyprenol monophosphomannose synthase [Anaerolineales bacterium]